MIAGGFGCSRPDNPQASFQHAQQTLRHGALIRAENEARQGYQRFHTTSPEWAGKFRNLEAEALLLRGLYSPGLTLLESDPSLPQTKDSIIQALVLKGAAHARLHHFPQAKQSIHQAEELCNTSSEISCGGVFRARGILSLQQGQPDIAKHFFEQTLDFARLHGDQFLEATALLNLGLGALEGQHYDEAMDRTDAAYRIAAVLDAGTIATKALGNLGWAYYNLGDSEKSLQLSLEAEQRAIQASDVIDQLSWITNAGYVYDQLHDFPRARQSYLKALDLARDSKGQEDIYNALRALALVSVENGDVDEARKYSDEAIKIAQADHNRLDELYPLLVKGLIAARSGDGAEAERIFREVEHDRHGNASLKWRAEHALARLYEDEKRPPDANHEYRAALSTFEQARSSLLRNDSRLPFSNNASPIYDDYIHFLVARGDPEQALRWADNNRARTLLEGLGRLSKESTRGGPPALNPREISRQAKGVLLFYWLGEKQSYLWTITPQKTTLFPGRGVLLDDPWPRLPVGRMLGPAVRRVLPVLLASIGAQVEDAVDEEEPVNPASRRRVGAIHVVAVAQEEAQHEALACAAVIGERRASRRRERHVPTSRLRVGRELGEWHVRHRGPADAQVREVAQVRDVVGERRAARAERVGAPVHELVERLGPTGKEPGERPRPVGRVEHVRVADADHRQAPPPCRERVQGARCLLLGEEELVAGELPLAASTIGGLGVVFIRRVCPMRRGPRCAPS